MNRYYFASVIFHIMALLLGIMILQPLLPSKQLGQPQVAVIQAYMQAAELTQSVSKAVENLAEKIKPAAKSVTRKREVSAAKQASQASVEQKARGEEVDELLRIMHQAIQQVKRYPASAQAMGREGRVTVAFKLLMSGEVADVVVRQSSGVSSLDQAAMEAVKSAAPFHGVDRYLSAPRLFAIDVVFSVSR